MEQEDRLRYTADLPTIGCSAPPGNSEIARVRDVLVIAGDPGVDHGSDRNQLALLPRRREWRLEEPEPIDLGRGLTLDQLDPHEAEMVLNACSARGHYFVPVKQYGAMYTLVLGVDPAELESHRWAWDTDRVIQDALAMSRLILDNGYSTEYAARIFDHDNGEQQIMPAFPLLIRQSAYRVRRTRDWLTIDEADEFKRLLQEFWAVREALPERVGHAIWQAENAVSVRWLDLIAPLLVVALETLVNTSRSLVTRVFKERVAAMTEEVGTPLSETLCGQIYDARSRWVHGSRVSLYRGGGGEGSDEGPTDADQRAAVERIAQTQDALRAVLRRCIEDPDFRAIFADDESIKRRWPVVV